MYEHVLSPIEIGGVSVPNRVVRTAHATGIGGGHMSPELIEYHAARARGGVGLTIIEILSVHPTSPASLNAFDPRLSEEYAQLVTACAPHGMKLFQQIWHAGHNGLPIDGSPPWSASDIPSPQVGVVPRPMSKGQIDEIVESYANTVKLCKDSGLHGVEIHGAHGYLLSQFLSPRTNQRSDAWGGPLENRARMLLEVVRAVRQAVGPDFPVAVKLNSADFSKNGFTLEESCQVVQWLEAEGVDLLEISGGTYEKLEFVEASTRRSLAWMRFLAIACLCSSVMGLIGVSSSWIPVPALLTSAPLQ